MYIHNYAATCHQAETAARAGAQTCSSCVLRFYQSALTVCMQVRTNLFMVSILLTLNALICAALIILILLQRSDPASGGMFGGAGGGGQTVVRNPLAKPTAILAALFLLFSIVTAIINKGGHHTSTVMDSAVEGQPVLPEASLVPTAPVTAVSDTIEVPAATVPVAEPQVSPTTE